MGGQGRGAAAPVRSSALAVAALGLLALGLLERERWPPAVPALDCAPEAVRLVEVGGGAVATCASEGSAPRGGAALALGLRLDLNHAAEDELAALPGVGRSLARRLVETRAAQGGRFRTWDEVDAVAGVGGAKLQLLRRTTELR
jgi:competence protein ComEA